MQQEDWPDRKDRHDIKVDAVVERTDGTSTHVTLTNVSRQGCRIDSHHDFRIGEHLKIGIPEVGTVKAQVRWALSDSAGLKFTSDSDS